MTDHEHRWQATLPPTDERAEIWRHDFGRLSVPIVSPVLEAVRVPVKGIVAAYLLDVGALTEAQRYRLAHALAARFDTPLTETYDGLEADGVPILADRVTVSTSCCAYVTGREAESPSDPELLAQIGGEMASMLSGPRVVTLRLEKVEAYWLMCVLQIAVKHPGVTGNPLQIAIDVARQIQRETCPPGSARERLALMGWVGR